MASKSKAAAQIAAASSLRTAASWLRGERRNVLLVLVVLVVLGIAAREGWKQYGSSLAHVEAYKIGPEGYQITPPPPWVRATIKNDVLRAGSLDNLSLLEVQTSRRVAQAFELHPWIAKVQRVSKHYPASISVELTYRRPVAVVEVEREGEPGLLPIDGDGVLLPPEDFSIGQVKSLPRIAVGQTFPAGAIGTAWGDERVASAATIAAILCDDWQHLPLHQIAVLATVAGSATRPAQFEIVARDGRRFSWGTAEADSSSLAAKRAELVNWLGEK